MAKALRVVSVVASIAAVVTGNPIFAAVAMAASVGSTLLQKKPPAQGSATRVEIGANMPISCAIGNRTYTAGKMVHDVGYGGTVNGVKNPYSSSVLVWSLGPVQSIIAFQGDFSSISFTAGAATGYYAGFMHLQTQLGACPEASALAGPWGAIPNWGASYKLSGLCAGLWSQKFDKKGKIYAAGVPQPGVILAGVYVYDMRQDSTFPGGSGACRALDEATYVGGDAADNPACHAVTYAMGRFQNDVKVFGPGFEVDAIDWPAWVAFANVCDANGWTVRGNIEEGPGISRFDNIKKLCAAGAAEPCFVGGLLSVRFSAPKVALDTISAADLAQGEIRIAGMKTYRSRLNGIVPKFRSEDNRWEYVQGDEVTVPTYVTEDGEEKSEERQYDLVQDKDQAAQLAAYELVNGRELGPHVVPCKPRLLEYRIGETLEGGDDLPVGLAGKLLTIIGRRFDPSSGIVELTLETETTAKHAFALGQTSTAPPTPSLDSGATLDDVVYSNSANGPITVASEAAMLALEVEPGTAVIRSDTNQTYQYNGGTAGTIADWTLVGVTTGGTATTTPFTPTGNIAATNVQAALAELDTEKQVVNAKLTAISGLTMAADQIIYWTGPTAAAATGLTGVARTLIAQTTQALMRSTGLGLGTAATFNTGTSGSTVALFSGLNTWGATQIFAATATRFVSATPYLELFPSAWASASFYQAGVDPTGTTTGDYVSLQLPTGKGFAVSIAGTSRLDVTATGIDVNGLVRCDTFRIDATPTAAAVTQTHHVPINLNGTTYKLLLAS